MLLAAPTVIEPLPSLLNPSNIAGADRPGAKLYVPPFVKLTNDPGPTWLIKVLLNVVTPLRVAPPVTMWVPGPRR